ncbi:TPA: prohibitin family protein, partial [Streptococcus suis]|nr:prohibitin family protein [Streptococcus suis]
MYGNEFQVTKRQVAAGATIIGLIIFAVFFRLTAVVKIPANTVGVKVSAFNGVQEKTLQTGYHLKVP